MPDEEIRGTLAVSAQGLYDRVGLVRFAWINGVRQAKVAANMDACLSDIRAYARRGTIPNEVFTAWEALTEEMYSDASLGFDAVTHERNCEIEGVFNRAMA